VGNILTVPDEANEDEENTSLLIGKQGKGSRKPAFKNHLARPERKLTTKK
jgi:hypothetical protein